MTQPMPSRSTPSLSPAAPPAPESTAPASVPQRVPWMTVVIFYALACALAWAAALPLWLSGQGLRTPSASVLIAAMMFAPAISALFVVFVLERRRPGQAMRRLGLWPLRPVRRTLLFTLVGLFGSALLVIAGVFLAAALGLIRLDLVGFSGFAELLRSASPAEIPVPLSLLVVIQLVSIPFGAIFNGFLTIGEEAGWRGWLLPALRPLGTWPALLISGAAWGLWHAPVILLGYNFAQPNLYGLGLMMVGCTLYGVLIGWLRLRSNSIWPPVFAHGAFNAAAGFAALVVAAGSTADPIAVNPLGWVTWIVMAVLIGALALSKQLSAGQALPEARA